MSGWVDLHCHLLPGMDDGAKNDEDMLGILRHFVDEGVGVINATPHRDPDYHNERQDILQKVADANRLIQDYQLPIKILPSQEIRISGEIFQDLENGKLVTVADSTRYLMIEFPATDVPLYSEKVFEKLIKKGLIPIIVHPERNQFFKNHPDKLLHFVEMGAYTQLTAASIVGAFGKTIQKFSFDILDANLGYTIASDAHNLKGRISLMKKAYDALTQKYDQKFVLRLQENAEAIINDQFPHRAHIRAIKKKKLKIF